MGYLLQPQGFDLYFRGINHCANGVWTRNPQLALCYDQEYGRETLFMMVTTEKPVRHGNGLVFGYDLDSIDTIPVHIKREARYLKAVNEASELLNTHGQDHIIFETYSEVFPYFLEYMVEFRLIRPTQTINDFLHSI